MSLLHLILYLKHSLKLHKYLNYKPH